MKAKTPRQKADKWRKACLSALAGYEAKFGMGCPTQRAAIEAKYQRFLVHHMAELLTK